MIREQWTHLHELGALLLEKLDELTIITAAVHTDPKARPNRLPRPFRYPRPIEQAPPPPATLDEIRRFFAR